MNPRLTTSAAAALLLALAGCGGPPAHEIQTCAQVHLSYPAESRSLSAYVNVAAPDGSLQWPESGYSAEFLGWLMAHQKLCWWSWDPRPTEVVAVAWLTADAYPRANCESTQTVPPGQCDPQPGDLVGTTHFTILAGAWNDIDIAIQPGR